MMSSAGRRSTSATICSVVATIAAAAAGPCVRSDTGPLLTPQVEDFLDRPIGKRKEHRLVGRLVCDGLPAGHDEDIARLPVDHEVLADAGPAASFDGDE